MLSFRFALRLSLLLVTPLFLHVAPVMAQTDETLSLTSAKVNDRAGVDLDKLKWKYHAGDDARGSEPQFDDEAWETLKSTSEPQTDFAQRE